MLSPEVVQIVQNVVCELLKTAVPRPFVPSFDLATFVDVETLPTDVQLWLAARNHTPEYALATLLLLLKDPGAPARGDDPHPFIISKTFRTNGWQTASAIALEAAISAQWPGIDPGITDFAQRPRFMTRLKTLQQQTVLGTRMSTVMEAIIKGMTCLAMAATIETTVLNMTWVAAAAAHLDLKSVQEKATQAVCMGTADMYASKLELGEARFEIANHIDQSGRFSQKAIQVPMFQSHDTATITQTKALVYEKLHSDIEAVRVTLAALTPSEDGNAYMRAMDAALRQLKTPPSILTALH